MNWKLLAAYTKLRILIAQRKWPAAYAAADELELQRVAAILDEVEKRLDEHTVLR